MSEYLLVTLAVLFIGACLLAFGLLVFGWGNPFPQPIQ